MTSARMDFRLDAKLKEKIEKASALSGAKSITEYVINLMEKDAERIIAQYESFTVEDDIFDRFMDACAQAAEPNQALKEAVDYTEKQDIR